MFVCVPVMLCVKPCIWRCRHGGSHIEEEVVHINQEGSNVDGGDNAAFEDNLAAKMKADAAA